MPSRTFNFTGEAERWNVPNDVEVVTVEITGGGSDNRAAGRVTGGIRVKGEKSLWMFVGRKGFEPEGRNGGGPCFGGGGAGGNGGAPSRDGGFGGGGASYIRLNAKDGPLRAVAGGAGGRSGDGSGGGLGGSQIGANGTHSATPGATNVADATGGTQNQGGKGGTSRDYPGLWGGDATGGRVGRGGRGGQADMAKSHGGGGGGGGFYPGGGGQGAAIDEAPGGGGAGGSNYTGGMFGAQTYQGTGGVGNGSITITWDTTHPPVPPQNITIDGQPISDGLATKALNEVLLRGTPNDPDAVRGVRMLVWMSTDPTFTKHRTFRGTYDEPEQRDKVRLEPLEPNTRYYLRLYTEDSNHRVSTSYVATNFWTDRNPSEPVLVSPAENVQITPDLNVPFQWQHVDPDPDDPQSAWKFRYRKMATPLEDAGEWTEKEGSGSAETWTVDAGTFKGNTFYEWSARTADQQGRWGGWAVANSFYVISETTPPTLVSPIKLEAVVAGEVNRFQWKFMSPIKGYGQTRADLRYQLGFTADPDEWITLFGDPVTPGTDKFWDIPAETFAAGAFYTWQVRTYDTDDNPSDWSEIGAFWAVATPGSGAGLDPILSGEPAGALGQGNNRAFVFQRGGTEMLGELTPLADIRWMRKRDDIASMTLHMTEWDGDMRGLLRSLRSWVHEIVVFREDGSGKTDRVAEGPITRIASRKDYLEIEFRCVMAYPYRRIMRQGYNDSYRVVDGQQVGLTPVTKRAKQIIMNCLAYDDPNVLPYLTPFEFPDDARCSRVRKDYSTMAWEEIDDLAAHGGLDYTTVGRRIILWDTHRPLGRLPQMGSGDFSEEPLITEYGASCANVFAVTNNNGLYGVATRGLDADGMPGPEGFIEQLASSYSESEGAGTERTLTREARRRAQEKLREQAQRNISGRYTSYGPSPKVVRVPDNATLNPTVNLGINQLIPGVWVPLRVDDGIIDLAQWQKIDSVVVEQDARGERVSVVMSPAPNDGQDPDADAAAEEG